MNWDHHHSLSEALAEEAEALHRAANSAGAEAMYREAAKEESLALAALEPEKVRTRGITAVSAVSLWYKGRDYATAKHTADHCLAAGNLPAFAEQELRSLLRVIGQNQQ